MAFWFNNISSDDMGVIVEKYPAYVSPTRKNKKLEAGGRTGSIYIDNGSFNNVTQTYDVYIHKEGETLNTTAGKVTDWLLSPTGYCKLTDTYNTDTYRMAVFTGPLSIKNIFNKFGRVSLKFDCDPRRYFVSGDEEQEFTNYVVNTTSFPSSPILTIHFTDSDDYVTFSDLSGDYTLTINAPSDTRPQGETFIFNSETGLITNSAGTPQNARFNLPELLELKPGKTLISASRFAVVSDANIKIRTRFFTL